MDIFNFPISFTAYPAVLTTVGASTSARSVVSVFSTKPVVPSELKFMANTTEGAMDDAALEELDESDEVPPPSTLLETELLASELDETELAASELDATELLAGAIELASLLEELEELDGVIGLSE